MAEIRTVSRELGGKTITIETGRVANLAGGAVTVRCGDTMVLCTATMARSPRPGMDFFPLTIECEAVRRSFWALPTGRAEM